MYKSMLLNDQDMGHTNKGCKNIGTTVPRVQKQAGADLCQTHRKLGLTSPALHIKKLWSSLKKTLSFSFICQKLRSSSICLQMYGVFHLTKIYAVFHSF
jgi:hypothetical protein